MPDILIALLIGLPLVGVATKLVLRLRLPRLEPGSSFEFRSGAFAELVGRELESAGVRQDALAFMSTGLPEGFAPGLPAPSGKGELPIEIKPPATGRPAWGAAMLDGAWPTGDMIQRWLSADSHVFQGVSHLTYQQIDTFADLRHGVQDRGYDLASEGFVQSLKGHVGGWHVRDAGDAAYEHLLKYPDIPVIVPHDAAHIPSDALHFDPAQGLNLEAVHAAHGVVVDDALSHADLVADTHHAADVLLDPGPHLHFPWITMAVSAVREGRLLSAGHTDSKRAAKNVAVDAGVVGGAGAIGVKAGAAFGAFLGPPGMVLGSLVGGIGGALLGRLAANKIKHAPLERAKAEYVEAVKSYEATDREVIVHVDRAWAQERAMAQAEMDRVATEAREGLAQRIRALQEAVRQGVSISREQAEAFAEVALEALLARRARARQALESRLGVMVHALPELAPREYVAWAALARATRNWQTRMSRLLAGWLGTPEQIEAFFDLMLAAPGGQILARRYVGRTIEARKQVFAVLAEEPDRIRAGLAPVRKALVDQLRERWEGLQGEARTMLEPAIARMQTAVEHLKSEMRKAGIKLDP